jgi:hypothetical protein
VKLVKGEGRATRARSLARLAASGRAVAWRVVSCRVVSCRDRDRDRDCFCHSCRSFMSVIIFCNKMTVTGN